MRTIVSALVEAQREASRVRAGVGDLEQLEQCGHLRLAAAPREALGEHQQRIQELYERLAGEIPVEQSERTEEEQGRWLLANMLDWHRREQKASWWEYFRLQALPDEELIEEKAALVEK